MSTAFSVTFSVTPTPYQVPVLWVDTPSELLPFDIARKSSAQEVLSKVFWGVYTSTDSLEHAYEAVRAHPAMRDLPPPPSHWSYPRLTTAMPPFFQWGYVQRWEGMGKPTSAVVGFNRLYKALRSDLKTFGPFKKAVAREVERTGLLEPHPLPPEAKFEVGALVFHPQQPQDSLAGWIGATLGVRFWSELLSYGGKELDGVLRTLGRDIYGLWGIEWDKRYSLLKQERHERILSIDPTPGLELAARVLHLHGGRKYLNRARVRGYLREAGLRGMQIPGPLMYTRAPEGSAPPIPGYIGAYHNALLELSRKTGPRACAHCGASFIPARSTARYCSGACRMAAHRSRERTKK